MTTNTKTKAHEAPCELMDGDRYMPAASDMNFVELPDKDALAHGRHIKVSPTVKWKYTSLPLVGWIIPGQQRMERYGWGPLPLPWPVLANGDVRNPCEPAFPWGVMVGGARDGWVWSAGCFYESFDNWCIDADHVIETDNKIRGRVPDDDVEKAS